MFYTPDPKTVGVGEVGFRCVKKSTGTHRQGWGRLLLRKFRLPHRVRCTTHRVDGSLQVTPADEGRPYLRGSFCP